MSFWTKKEAQRKNSTHHKMCTRFAVLLITFFCCWLTLAGTNGFRFNRAEGKKSLVPAQGGAFFQSENVAVYVAKRGDTFSNLARRFYSDPEKAWMIQEANELVTLKPGQVLVIPMQPLNPGGLSAEGYQVVPILTYHHFSEQCSNTLCMPVKEFARQMAYLKREGYRAVTMKEVLKFMHYQRPLPRKTVAITIDDGYRSVYDLAYPILERYNFTATLFIYTDFINKSPNALTWKQLNELIQRGFEVEAHTITHADLTRQRIGESEVEYLERIRRELQIPRTLIREHLGKEAVWLAYPYGRFNNLVISLAIEAGYRGGVTVTRGSTPFFANPFKVGRNQVMNPVKKHSFEELVKFFHRKPLK